MPTVSEAFQPTVQEFVLFAVIMTLIILIARLMHYTSIRRRGYSSVRSR